MDKVSGYFVGLIGEASSRPSRDHHHRSLCNARQYEYMELQKATNKFKSFIRQGESGDLGPLYKGVLPRGKVIAVQTLQREGKLDKQHENLLKALSELCHRNLLKLEGYCIDERGSYLCYEYQCYQTLEECLLGTYKKLSWQQRTDILRGICDGLKYLQEIKSKVKMHVDLKLDKILLHEDKKSGVLTPKISECVIWGQREDDVPAPRYYYFVSRREESFYPEIDIHSFGILLMMIVTDRSKTTSKENELIAKVQRHYKNKDFKALRDRSLNSDCQAEIDDCIELAIRCTSLMRPSVDQIALTLANLGQARKKGSVGDYQKRTYTNLQYNINFRHNESSDGLGLIKVDHVREYTYDELKRATDNFASDQEIGRGAFGIVYKGVLDGKIFAVKKLQKDKFSGQFLNEVSILSMLRHRNLMKLEGYCFHSQGTMLCYEYLPDGTLQDRLGDQHNKLSWNERYNIILGICRGLHYLHDECPDGVRIVHMDLKTDNILVQIDINGAVVPKIGDFGIAWPLDMNKEHEYTNNPLGNIMCTPPEYQHDGKITTGVDIYSFGLIMLEMITGKPRTYSKKSSHYGRHIINQARNHLKQQDLRNLIDQSMGNDCLEQVHECIEVALDCVGSDETTRPDIAQVSLRLAQVGQKHVGRKLLRCNGSRHGTSLDKDEPAMGEHEKNIDSSSQYSQIDVSERSSEMMTSDTTCTANADGNIINDQHEVSSNLSLDPGTTGSMDSTPKNARQMPVPYNPSDLDFTLDFEAIFEGSNPVEIESSATREKQEMETDQALKQLYQALCDLCPYQISEASVFIEDMAKRVLTKTSPTAVHLRNALEDLLIIISSDSDAIKKARDRAAQKMEINEKKSRCSKLKAIMQENAVEAKVLGQQLAFLKERREVLRVELEKIDSKLKDIPALIAEKKKKGMEAQAEGKTLAEQVVKDEAEIGDTSADDALLERVQAIHRRVCTQLEGIVNKI